MCGPDPEFFREPAVSTMAGAWHVSFTLGAQTQRQFRMAAAHAMRQTPCMGTRTEDSEQALRDL